MTENDRYELFLEAWTAFYAEIIKNPGRTEGIMAGYQAQSQVLKKAEVWVGLPWSDYKDDWRRARDEVLRRVSH